MRYWVISGDPTANPIFEDLQDPRRFKRWSVSSRKEDLKIGDKIAFWVSGPDRGIYMFAEVSRAPYPDDHWIAEKFDRGEKCLYIGLKEQRAMVTEPILGEDLKELPSMQKLYQALTNPHRNPIELTKTQWNFLQDFHRQPKKKLNSRQEIVEIQGELQQKALVTVRKTQARFRKLLLMNSDTGNCLLCGRRMAVDFLIAAHIKPWSKCSELEKRDYSAGMMLCCKFGCDYLFEVGFIGVSAQGRLIVSPELDDSSALSYLKKYSGRKVSLTVNQGRYFKWHRSNQFVRS